MKAKMLADPETKARKALASLAKKQARLSAELRQLRASKRFECACCKTEHTISECVAIQTHYYISPRGCSEGDYWLPSEMQIICPITDAKNRVHFNSTYAVEYSVRRDYAYSADAQFQRIYGPLFKAVIQDYAEDNRSWENTQFFDQHRKFFGLHVKGLD